MSGVSDKPRTILTIVICAVITAIVYALIAKFNHDQFVIYSKNSGFWIGLIVGYVVFAVLSWIAFKKTDGAENDNFYRALVIAITIVIVLWNCIWMAANNEKVAPGSPQMEQKAQNDNGQFKNSSISQL
jgi:quinol-cytochrome oxidoreductase complex cytochrome b subunit